MRYRAHIASLTCASALLLPATLAHAQTEDSQTRRSGAARAALEEVMVTARKKSAAESAQNVPVTLTAVSGDQIEAMFATSLTEVGMTMPNVRLDDAGAFPGAANYTVRGMGFNSTIASVEPTVGLFVDGIYIGSNLGGLADTFDTESVEVLRGPQGTLFGRNVTGGAVVMRSRRPTGEFGGVLRGGVGSGGRQLLAAGVEAGITDNLAGKLYLHYSDRDGDFDNITTGGDHGAEEIRFARPMLRWQPGENLDVNVIGEYGRNTGDGVTARFIEIPGQLEYEMGAREPRRADQISINRRGYTNIEWSQLVVDANWDVGHGTVTSITGYRDVRYASEGDTDATEFDNALALNASTQDQFSQELRYATSVLDGRLDYTVGLYYFQQEMEQFYHVRFFGASNQRSRGQLEHRTGSVFAQGEYELLPDLRFTLGGRYTWEEKEARNARTPDCDLDMNCLLSDTGKETWENFSPKVGLSWQLTPDTLLYTSWSKGFRSGGYNIRTTGVNESAGPYDQEEVEAIELGLKSDFWDGRGRVNMAVFKNKYEDLQRTVNRGLVNFIANVAAATVEGAELELTLLPIDSLSLTATVGYLNAEYDSYPDLDVDGDGSPDPEQAKGLRLIRAPEWSYSLAAVYDLSLGSAGLLSTRVAVSFNDETPANDANTYMVDDWTLWDASTTWSPANNEELKVSLWGKNLTNEVYAATGTVVGSLWTNLYQSLPRRYGVEVTYRF